MERRISCDFVCPDYVLNMAQNDFESESSKVNSHKQGEIRPFNVKLYQQLLHSHCTNASFELYSIQHLCTCLVLRCVIIAFCLAFATLEYMHQCFEALEVLGHK